MIKVGPECKYAKVVLFTQLSEKINHRKSKILRLGRDYSRWCAGERRGNGGGTGKDEVGTGGSTAVGRQLGLSPASPPLFPVWRTMLQTV